MSSDLPPTQETGRIPSLGPRARSQAVATIPAAGPGRYLVVEDGEDEVVIPITEQVTRIGRSVNSTVHLDDPTVSRRHAMVVVRGDRLVVLDDRSMNGTFVNGERVQEATLSDGDVIEVGRVRVRFLDVSS